METPFDPLTIVDQPVLMTDEALVDNLTRVLSREQIEALKDALDLRIKTEEDKPLDLPLDQPVHFVNARYPWERFRIPGRSRPLKFMAGAFTARTSLELEYARRLGSHVFEGHDVTEPLIDERTGRRFFNSRAYNYFMNKVR